MTGLLLEIKRGGTVELLLRGRVMASHPRLQNKIGISSYVVREHSEKVNLMTTVMPGFYVSF